MESQDGQSYSPRDPFSAPYMAQQQSGMGMPYGLFHYGGGYPLQMPPMSNVQKPGLRRGKWTEEEIKLTDRIIETFNAGTLQLPEEMGGVTLRSYLAEKLGCDPMRITKKYTGASCLGKRVYHGNNSAKVSPDVLQAVKEELDELEARFRSRLDQSNKEKREHEADVEMLIKNHVVSTPAIDAMFMQGAAGAAGAMQRVGWGYPGGQVPMHMYQGYMGMNFPNGQYMQPFRPQCDFYPSNYAAASAAGQMHFAGGQMPGQAWMYGLPGPYGPGIAGMGNAVNPNDDASTVPESALPPSVSPMMGPMISARDGNSLTTSSKGKPMQAQPQEQGPPLTQAQPSQKKASSRRRPDMAAASANASAGGNTNTVSSDSSSCGPSQAAIAKKKSSSLSSARANGTATSSSRLKDLAEGGVESSENSSLCSLTLPGATEGCNNTAGPASVTSDEGSMASTASSHKDPAQDEDQTSAANSLLGFYAQCSNGSSVPDNVDQGPIPRPIPDGCMVKKEMTKTVCEDIGDVGLPPMKIARKA